MKTFHCRVVDARGRRHAFERSGSSRDAILRDLASQDYFILGVTEGGAPVEGKAPRLPRRVVLEFTQALALFLANGLTLKQALTVASDLYQQPQQRALWKALATSIEKGHSLHQSLLTWKGSFSPLYLGLIRLGETAGDLSTVLGRLAVYLKTGKELRDKTANALVYPALVLAVTLVGLVLLATFVLPTLTTIVGTVNQGASLAYRSKIDGFQEGLGFALTIFGTLVLVIAAVALRRGDGRARTTVDRLLWGSPLGKVYLQVEFGLHFSFAMETLLAAGYPVENSLQESLEVVTNRWVRSRLTAAREAVVRGESLSKAFRLSGDFPQTLTAWVAVGEGANDLARSFGQLRAHYQHELEQVHARFASLVEPGFILLVGGLLVTVVLNFVAPIFTMLGDLL